jgi:hypothetical protein
MSAGTVGFGGAMGGGGSGASARPWPEPSAARSGEEGRGEDFEREVGISAEEREVAGPSQGLAAETPALREEDRVERDGLQREPCPGSSNTLSFCRCWFVTYC